MCGCAQRRIALVSAAKAFARGDAAMFAAQASFVARSTARDAQAALATRIAIAKTHLGR